MVVRMRSWRLAGGVLGVLVALSLPGVAEAADWYVAPSPTGNDANDCTLAHPCAHASHVIGLGTTTDGDTIHIAAGQYADTLNTAKRLNFVGAGPGTADDDPAATVI